MSQINVNQLDETYPQAGVDNNSQGFRDNFNIIKTNLEHARTEIEQLQTNAVQTDTDNQFNGNMIENANFNQCTYSAIAGGTLLDDYSMSFADAAYHSYTVGENITIALDGWPAGRYAKMTAQIIGVASQENILYFKGPLFAETVRFSENWPNQGMGHFLTTLSAYIYIVEFWSVDGGATVFANYLGKF